jgi:hypothetical protein
LWLVVVEVVEQGLAQTQMEEAEVQAVLEQGQDWLLQQEIL